MQVPQSMCWLFWDVEPERLDTETNKHYIFARVLEFGRLEDVRWLLARYELSEIHAFFKEVGHTEISEKTRVFWKIFLNAEKETWTTPPLWRNNSCVPWPS